MTVYVLEVGWYAQGAVAGVYATVEAAKASVPHLQNWRDIDGTGREWSRADNDSGRIEAFEVKE